VDDRSLENGDQNTPREPERGHSGKPAEMKKAALDARFEESMAQIDRGEGIPGDRILDVLAERRQTRNPRS
jgi:hypothetical protein